MQKLKILHIIKSLGRGGAEMLLPETLKKHDTINFEFHYIYFLPWKDQMVSSIESSGGKVTCLSAKNNLQLLTQYRRVIGYCKLKNINLIHCHLPWAGFLGRLVYLKTKIPVVYTEHNMQERYHIITKKINQFTYNSQSIGLGVSEDVSKSIKKNINPSIPVRTLLNGVNTDTFRRNIELGIKTKIDLGIPQESFVIGNVAVFRFQKRIVEWLQVLKKIIISNPNVYGIIVGAGPLEEEIKAELLRLKLENKVKFTGLQTNVKPYFSAMDIFMMSSSFEGLPIALLEAMSMECAIVSTNAGGIKEVIKNENNGLICDVEEWEKLSDLCLRLINNPHELKTYQKEARKRVLQEFSMNKMVKSLESLYEELIF